MQVIQLLFVTGLYHCAGGEWGGEKKYQVRLATCMQKKRTMHDTHEHHTAPMN